MALKTMLFLLASFLVLTTRVTSDEVQSVTEHDKDPAYAPMKPPAHPPFKAPVHPPVNAPMPMQHGCTPMCEERCKTHHKKRPCMKVCTACCHKCKCVPPGPSGNEEKCVNWDHVILHGQMFSCP